MTAVIMAAGEDPRKQDLRKIKGNLPPALLDICGIPLIEYIIRHLKRYNISDIIIAADERAEMIAEVFDEGSLPMFSVSSVSAGRTAALVSALTSRDIPEDEIILVINGNALSDCDYGELVCRHISENNICTFAAVKDGENIFTGDFAVNCKDALNFPEYGNDIYSDVIPALTKFTGNGIFLQKGYFSPVQTPEDIMKVNADVLTGFYPYTPETVIIDNEVLSLHTKAKAELPVCIGENAKISENAVIGKGTCIGRNVTVGSGTVISGSVIGSGTNIGDGCVLTGAFTGTGVRICNGGILHKGAKAGDNSVISEYAEIASGVQIQRHCTAAPFSLVTEDICSESKGHAFIDEDGLTGRTGCEFTPQFGAVAGCAAAMLGETIVVGHKGEKSAMSAAFALSAGITSAGSKVYFAGETTLPELAFCVRALSAAAGCFIEGGVSTKVKFVSSDGLPLSRSQEKLIEDGINHGEYHLASFKNYGEIISCREKKGRYLYSLSSLLGEKLNGINVTVKTYSSRIKEICRGLLSQNNDPDGEKIVFTVSDNGTSLSAYTDGSGTVSHEKLVMLGLMQEFRKGRDVSLPSSFPMAADTLAESFGCTLYRYSSEKSGGEIGTHARLLAGKCDLFSDGIKLMLTVLCLMNETGLTISQLCERLPVFAHVTRFVPIDMRHKSNAELLRHLGSEKAAVNDGIVIGDSRGKVRIRPLKTGKGIMLDTECFNMETASELCDFYQEKLKRL